MRRAPIRRTALIAVVAALALMSTLAQAGDAPASQPSAKTDVAAPAAAVAPAAAAVAAEAPDGEPAHITVQHILIGFTGSVPRKNITRTQEAARALASQILARARKGEDFDALVKQYTDDSPPGIYAMANNNVAPGKPVRPGLQEFARGGMVKAFGNVGFSLKVGQIGMAEFDHATSPFGWHIIKRLD
jgi:hypothetical protein